MVNVAPANTIRRRRHRSMFTVSANGVVLGKGLLDLVELALVILGERHDPFSSAPGWGDSATERCVARCPGWSPLTSHCGTLLPG